ncbi:hypothetical protein L226DRAFT_83087 [Lentinus tigrinus ALCF2SS1-7]|uniref:Uncharacterized protein n=1 Tax=Lentinus tigrinus ALCF2SS1-6 TaxID=1328759 RepID=A0A5C2RVX6_9APHY|nr:hypothetical protein L227DRAFT_335933 [Lentinus tigrinus ALCF2SS1-6]RPD74130.1 hypothetical protein L226DRAFT_83087 [Lentinus tigrinus ALCF2SS1-7]
MSEALRQAHALFDTFCLHWIRAQHRGFMCMHAYIHTKDVCCGRTTMGLFGFLFIFHLPAPPPFKFYFQSHFHTASPSAPTFTSTSTSTTYLPTCPSSIGIIHHLFSHRIRIWMYFLCVYHSIMVCSLHFTLSLSDFPDGCTSESYYMHSNK